MKIVITESQYRRFKEKGVLNEQNTGAFYTQEKTASGAVNPQGNYVYNSGVGPFKKPAGAIDAKQLYPYGPPQGGYPQIIPLQQIKNSQVYKMQQAGQGAPPIALPADWQREEPNYAAFNEPLGKPERAVPGKYKKLLPAQTNKYFYDPNLEVKTPQKVLNQAGKTVNQTVTKKGGWVIKSLANVDSWRDVPKGYYPPDYPKALQWDKQQEQNSNSSSSESTAVNIQTLKRKNPYFRPEFPLGNSQEAIRMYDAQIDAKQKEAEQISKGYKEPVPGSDHFANVDLKNQEKRESLIRQAINADIDKINAAFGRYVEEQKAKGEEGYDWVGFLLTVASILPVVGQAAMVVNVGYNLVSAYRAYENGDYTQAGLNVLFAVLPQVSSYLKGVNPLNIVAKGGAEAVNIEKYLAQNASKFFTEITSKLGGGVSENLAKFANNPQVLLTLEKIIGKQTSELSARGFVKSGAQSLDTALKPKTLSYSNNYVPAIN